MATLGKAGFARSIALPVLIPGVILFAPANVRSDSAPKAFSGKQADHTSAVSEIRSVLRIQQDAWNHGDIDRFMDGYARSRDTIFISEDTVRRGWETVRDRYRENIPIARSWGSSPFPISRSSRCRQSRQWRLDVGNYSGQRIGRTGDLLSFSGACRRGGGLCTIIRRRLRRRSKPLQELKGCKGSALQTLQRL
jgi:hypothetical protein